MKNRNTILGALGLAAIVAASCTPPPPPPPPVLNDPAKCGLTKDGKDVVTLAANAGLCTTTAGQKLVIVAEECGPLFGGSLAVDDCWRGSIPGRPSPDVWRYGTITGNGGTPIVLVASDAVGY